MLYREPADWILCYLHMGTSRWSSNYTVMAIVQLLAVPKEFMTGLSMRPLGQGTSRGMWKAAANVVEAEPAMRDILELIQTEALPEFDRVGTVPGYTALAEELARRDPQDVHYNEAVFCLRLIRDDIEGALRAAEAVSRAARADGADWALELDARVTRTADAVRRDPGEALQLLRANVAFTRSHLGLPPAADVAP